MKRTLIFLLVFFTLAASASAVTTINNSLQGSGGSGSGNAVISGIGVQKSTSVVSFTWNATQKKTHTFVASVEFYCGKPETADIYKVRKKVTIRKKLKVGQSFYKQVKLTNKCKKDYVADAHSFTELKINGTKNAFELV